MNTIDQPPVPETTSAPSASTMSLTGRLFNIFAVPGEVFDTVKAGPASSANWLMPALISAIIAVISVFIIFSQPAVIQEIREQQTKVIDDQVKAGKMTQAQADQGFAFIDKYIGPTTMKIAGGVSSVIGSFARIFWWAFVLWILSRTFLKAPVKYLTLVEVAGLASMILVLGIAVTTLLSVSMGKPVGPNMGLLLSHFDVKNKIHLLLGAVNIFNLWFAGVLSVGLSRLASVPFARALLVFGGFWVVWNLVLILIGMGQLAL